MPKISEFFGLSIHIYSNDHPPPHIHVIEAERVGVLDIESCEFIVSDRGISKRGERIVKTWARRHCKELLAAWREIAMLKRGKKVQVEPYMKRRRRDLALTPLRDPRRFPRLPYPRVSMVEWAGDGRVRVFFSFLGSAWSPGRVEVKEMKLPWKVGKNVKLYHECGGITWGRGEIATGFCLYTLPGRFVQ